MDTNSLLASHTSFHIMLKQLKPINYTLKVNWIFFIWQTHCHIIIHKAEKILHMQVQIYSCLILQNILIHGFSPIELIIMFMITEKTLSKVAMVIEQTV